MGRLKKPWFEVARLKYWYWPVAKIKGDRPDYGLDLEFAYRKSLPSGRGRYRRRVFEWIRKAGRAPRGGDPNLRSIEEIIEAVDAHPDLRGTAACYYSKFWELFSLPEMTSADICERIDHFFDEYHLERCSPKEIKGYKSSRVLSSFSPQYSKLLSIALSDIDDLSAGYFVCLLNLEREVSGRIFGILDHFNCHSIYLERFFTQHIKVSGEEYYSLAIKHLNAIKVKNRSTNSDAEKLRWGQLTWPICKIGEIPKLEDPRIDRN